MQNQEYNKAVHTGEEAMELAEQNEDPLLWIHLLHNLGKGYMEIGEAGKALEILEMGLAFSQKTPKNPLQGKLFVLIGEAVFKNGDIPSALKHLKKGLEAVRKANDRVNEGPILIQLTEVHMQSQGEELAKNYFEDVLSLSVKTKDRLLEGKALWSWSLSLNKKGSVEEAITWGQKAPKIYDALKNSEAIDIRNKIKSWSGE